MSLVRWMDKKFNFGFKTSAQEGSRMPPSEFKVWVDADDCHLQREIVRLCKGYDIVPQFVYNKVFAYYTDTKDVVVITVPVGFDSAEACILDNLLPGDLVLTDDANLAADVLEKGAAPLDFRGRWFTEINIDERLASYAPNDSHPQEGSKRRRKKSTRTQLFRLRRQLKAYLKSTIKGENL